MMRPVSILLGFFCFTGISAVLGLGIATLFQLCFGLRGEERKLRVPNSGTCKRGLQKGVSLICFDSENKSAEIRAKRNKSVYFPNQGAQIGTHRKKTGKSEQIEVTPFCRPPKWGLR